MKRICIIQPFLDIPIVRIDEGMARPVLHCSRIGIEYLKNCL